MNRIGSLIYPELDDVLERFGTGIELVLGENLVGMYLVGSLATGDFDLDSDVDFLTVTRGELSDRELAALGTAHVEIHEMGTYPAKHLEGSYISEELLNRSAMVGVEALWYVDNGSTKLERSVHDNQWHVRWVLRERGITLCGPEPKSFVKPVAASALSAEMAASIRNLRDKFLADIQLPAGWFSMRFGQSFAVLTCCRMLHTMQTGTVESKLAGVRWAEEALDPAWRELIREAWAERIGVRFGEKVRLAAEKRAVAETAGFLEFATEYLRR